MSVVRSGARLVGELEVHPLVDLRYGQAERGGGPVGPRRCPDRDAPGRLGLGGLLRRRRR
jgi:hypothetical protein